MPEMLYDTEKNSDACGVGIISKPGEPTHETVKECLTALECNEHRGATFDGVTGDGAGIETDIPWKLLNRELASGKDNVKILKEGYSFTGDKQYGVSQLFLPTDPEIRKRALKIIEEEAKKLGLDMFATREVPFNAEGLSARSLENKPHMEQAFFSRPADMSDEEYDKLLHKLLLRASMAGNKDPEIAALNSNPAVAGMHITSMSGSKIIYKGAFTTNQVRSAFPDLSDEDYLTTYAKYHSRFATNTRVTWKGAHPYQMVAHNGEINTINGNVINWLARMGAEGSEFELIKGLADSGQFDQILGYLVVEKNIPIEEAVLMMMPPAWQHDETLDEKTKKMFEHFSLSMEPFDGPAHMVITFGDKAIIKLDRAALRPSRVAYNTRTGVFVVGSEEGVYQDFVHDPDVVQGALGIGGILVFDRKTGKFSGENVDLDDVEVASLYEELTAKKDYKKLVSERIAELKVKEPEVISIASMRKKLMTAGIKKIPEHQKSNLGGLSHYDRMRAYGWFSEIPEKFAVPMALTGAELVIAMGDDTAAAYLSKHNWKVSQYMKQRFAQVTNPPIDPIREAENMSLRVNLGPKMFAVKDAKQIALETPVIDRDDLSAIIKQKHIPVVKLSATVPYPATSEKSIKRAIRNLMEDSEKAAKAGAGVIIISDEMIGKFLSPQGQEVTDMPIDITMAVAAVNRHLINKGLRPNVSIVVESGQVTSTHDVNVLLSFGASAVCPTTLLDEAARTASLKKSDIDEMVKSRVIDQKERKTYDDLIALGPYKAQENIIKALSGGVKKTMAKMGIMDVESYIAGQHMEALGLCLDKKVDPFLAEIFAGVSSPVGGHTMKQLTRTANRFMQVANDNIGQTKLPYYGKYDRKAPDNVGERGFGKTFVSAKGAGQIGGTKGAKAAADDRKTELAGIINGSSGRTAKVTIFTKAVGDDEPEEINIEVGEAGLALLKLAGSLGGIRSVENGDVVQLTDIGRGFDKFILSISQGDYEKAFAELKKARPYSQEQIDKFELSPAYREYVRKLKEIKDEQGIQQISDMFEVKSDKKAIDISEASPVSKIVKQFKGGGMSLGALTDPAHAAVATSFNMIGAASNTGEGGEPSNRWHTMANGKIKQVASGRFGVNAKYLANAEEIEIKIVQGAKPGEGGQLPGKKVSYQIAIRRRGTPGVELISPPPHHDIYSIEDLSELIYDIASCSQAKIAVKLAASEGVGTVAVGVAKALANAAGINGRTGKAGTISIAGGSGGTGAANITSIYNTGMPYELGLREVHQALRANGLEDAIDLRTSGGFKSADDIIKAAIYGANEFEIGTSALVMLNCIMAGTCNIDCPVGVTTTPDKFKGDPEVLAKYLLSLGKEVQEKLAALGFKDLEELRGRTDLLKIVEQLQAKDGVIDHEQYGHLDLNPLLRNPEKRIMSEESKELLGPKPRVDDKVITDGVIEKAKTEKIVVDGGKVTNCDRAVGGRISIEAGRVYEDPWMKGANPDEVKVAEDQLTVKYNGIAGQSFGYANTYGVSLELTGSANDGVGKSMSGGYVVVKASEKVRDRGRTNVVAGNVVGFGATGGKLYLEGKIGDRAALRNSGATIVCEGMGSFACEYMTSGMVLNLGKLGKGFGVGMTGGIAIQYDPEGKVRSKHKENENLSGYSSKARSEYQEAIKTVLEDYAARTGSKKASEILKNWEKEKDNFSVFIPKALERGITTREQIDEVDKAYKERPLSPAETVWAKSQRQKIESSSFLGNQSSSGVKRA